MALLAIFGDMAGRELTMEEVELLQVLSPQGLAKVNADQSKGVDPAETLAQLKVVYQASQKRKTLIESLVPEAVLPVVRQMSRAPTAEEMVLFAGVSSATLLHRITCRTKGGEAVDDIVQELAEEHRLKLLQCNAKRLADEERKPICLTPLSPTHLDTTRSLSLTVSVVELAKTRRLRLGPGPVSTWFLESAPESLLESSSLTCTPRSPPTTSTLSPRSALRKGPSRRRGSVGSTRSSLGPCTCSSEGSEDSLPSGPRVSFGLTVEAVETKFTEEVMQSAAGRKRVAGFPSSTNTGDLGTDPRAGSDCRGAGLAPPKPTKPRMLQTLGRLFRCHCP